MVVTGIATPSFASNRDTSEFVLTFFFFENKNENIYHMHVVLLISNAKVSGSSVSQERPANLEGQHDIPSALSRGKE
jgi:hypothetical protein